MAWLLRLHNCPYFNQYTMPLKLLIILGLLLPTSLFSQVIKGVVTNYEQKPIPFATIYIEELQTGTSANQQGKYEVHVSPGTYNMSFRAMGNTPQTKIIEVGDLNIELNIQLQMQSYILAGVIVRADAEDPAYSIMRKAIARAPGFINQAKSYSSEVYIKGSVTLDKIPKILQKRMEVNGERPEVGQTYVNESLNRISFEAPDKYTQEVISVNNSFPMGENDVPVIELISGSIYESQDDFYISPFAPNAFSHYKFEYEGLLQDGAWFIDKIKVIPKRKSQLLMEGYVYIVEDLWCMYSYDIILRPQFMELKMKQHYAPVRGNSYFPVNLFIEAKISVMGIKGGGNYTTTIKYDHVILDPRFSQSNVAQSIKYTQPEKEEEFEEPKVDPKVEELDKKLEVLLKNDELSNREMIQMQKLMAKKAAVLNESVRENPLQITSNYEQIVNKSALVRDSVYWDSIRPVPASDKEKISYRKVDEKQEKEDSTSAFVKALKKVAFGNYEWERSKKFHLYSPGLLATRNVGFNPVDGLQLKHYFKIRWNIDSLKFMEIKTTGGYAWQREQPFGETNIWLKYNKMKDSWLEINGGWLAADYNLSDGTPENLSAIYNLFLKESYIKFYDRKYVSLKHRTDIANGLAWFAGGQWQQTDTLLNNTDFSIVYTDSLYDENKPINQELAVSNLNPSKTATIFTGFTFTPKSYFKIQKGEKKYMGSKWPTFELYHYYALPLKNEYSSFHHTQLSINQTVDFFGISSISYLAKGGVFFGKKNVHFSDFKHFKTMEEPFTTNDFKNTFMLLNNYEYSTAKSYFQGHFKYTTQFLLLKRLPWISGKLWNENLSANFLMVDGHKPYYEAGYSMGQIFFAGEVGVYAGFKGTEFHGVGVRAAFKF